MIMLRNYLIITFRNLWSQKFYSLINIAGLSIGITACILVALYIRQDLKYDTFNTNARQIYRVGFSVCHSGVRSYHAQTPALMGPTLKEKFPEIRKMTRLYFSGRDLVAIGDKKFFQDGIAYADSTIFDVFSFQALAGDSRQFFSRPNSMVLTETTARKYFGMGNPVGKTIMIDNKYRFEVTGVIKDVPVNSHFRFEFLADYSSLKDQPEGNYIPQWGTIFGSYTYILAEKGFDLLAFEKKATKLIKTYADVSNEGLTVALTPLTDIHLKSHLGDEIEENSSVSRIYILTSIAFFVLLLACINFVNLSTARSSKRNMEIGMRKAFGAVRGQLILQFLGESVLFSMIAFILSLITVFLVMPFFSMAAGTTVEFNFSGSWPVYLLMAVLALAVGILAGLYPSFYFSSFQVSGIIKDKISSDHRKISVSFLRKGLVILQFAISIVLIAGTIAVNLQLRYLRNYNMGFDKEYMIVVPVHQQISDRYATIKNELKNIPGVIRVTAGLGAPVCGSKFGTECRPNGVNNPKGSFPIEVNSVDYDYMDHFGVKLLAGRNFSNAFQTDFPDAMIVNEKMVRMLGFKNPQEAIGKSYALSLNDFKPRIIGVISDFNSNSLHDEMMPQVFLTNPDWFRAIILKVTSNNISSTLGKVKERWTGFFPQYPFEYRFLDETIGKLYRSEEKYAQVILVFSTVALFIACLGLLGLASFVTEQRKKEIGIRKVQGAATGNIIRLISGDFLVLVLIANIIAWPVAYYFLNKWLLDFAYRIALNIWIFICAGGLAFLIALLTVSFQATKAALANPAVSLKCE